MCCFTCWSALLARKSVRPDFETVFFRPVKIGLRRTSPPSPPLCAALDNTCFCSIIQASKLVLGSLLAKNNFFVQFWTKNFASSRMADCGSGLPAEWPFRSQNAIEASDSTLPGGLWVKRLITHALCSLAYSDIAWCKLFLILTMKGLY